MTNYVGRYVGKPRRRRSSLRKPLAIGATVLTVAGMAALYNQLVLKPQDTNLHENAATSQFQDFGKADIKAMFDDAFRARSDAKFEEGFNKLGEYEKDPRLTQYSARELQDLKYYGLSLLETMNKERQQEAATFERSF